MSLLEKYTSTGMKLLKHPEILAKLREGIPVPISLQVAPTSRCNLKCNFCSNVNRTSQEDLSCDDLTKALVTFKKLGLKTVEWTGGGDPTLYAKIQYMMLFSSELGFEQGFITNGVALWDAYREHPAAFNKLTWLRISMNCLDYVQDIRIPFLGWKTVLGFSYVMNSLTTVETFR